MLASASGEPLYEPGDGSVWEKLQILYVDSKHMNMMIAGEKIPSAATTGIWITNTGIESGRGTLSFTDLYDMLQHMRDLAVRLSTMRSNA